MNEFSKAAGYKGNTQKSVTFLYTNNEQAEKEITGQYSPPWSMTPCKPYKDPNDVFCRNRKTHPEINMESQGTLQSQKEKKKILAKNKAGGRPFTDFRTWYSNQNHVVLAYRRTQTQGTEQSLEGNLAHAVQ